MTRRIYHSTFDVEWDYYDEINKKLFYTNCVYKALLVVISFKERTLASLTLSILDQNIESVFEYHVILSLHFW